MKFLTLFIITLWMISMFVMAGETEGNNQKTEQDQKTNNGEEMMDSEKSTHDYEGDWRRCYWTE